MFVQTEPTPNPATLKFLPGKTVMEEGTIFFQSDESAENSPLATNLFAIRGVESVFLGPISSQLLRLIVASGPL